MKAYGVKELAALSGVTIRTIHYYHKIGLLQPAFRSEAGYRYYEEKELLRLQQILFYRELDLPLRDIQDVLDDPDFELIAALESHKIALKARRKRITSLLSTIDNTLMHLNKGAVMSKPEILYKGLPKEVGTRYRDEAMKKFGKDVVKHSEQELLKMGKEAFESLKAELEWVFAELFVIREEAPHSQKVQSLIATHYSIIRKLWGTSGTADKQAEAYSGLGHLYLSDDRYTMMYGQPQPDFARFLQKAMSYYAEKALK